MGVELVEGRAKDRLLLGLGTLGEPGSDHRITLGGSSSRELR
jgi:hypothetical protein